MGFGFLPPPPTPPPPPGLVKEHTLYGFFLQHSHCSHVGPHLGTLVPMGTKMRFLVPILFQSPHFPHFRLKNASKVSAATIYRLDVNHLITCDKQIYSQNFIANTDALKP